MISILICFVLKLCQNNGKPVHSMSTALNPGCSMLKILHMYLFALFGWRNSEWSTWPGWSQAMVSKPVWSPSRTMQLSLKNQSEETSNLGTTSNSSLSNPADDAGLSTTDMSAPPLTDTFVLQEPLKQLIKDYAPDCIVADAFHRWVPYVTDLVGSSTNHL